MRALIVGSICLLAVACDYDYDALRGPRRDSGVVGPSDGGVTGLDPNAVCESAFYCQRLSNGVDQLDLLFVVDNSNSMSEEQAAFTRELPDMVRSLTRGDVDLDGDRDFLPIASLRVGIVTSDMGVGTFTVPTCSMGHGDDGVLRREGREAILGCDSSYPPVFEFAGSDVDSFAADVACVASVGTGGCGFEQPLDAALKALSPSVAQSWTQSGFVAPRFLDDSTGHADGANRGFVRDSSVLAVILLTDEEDCSVPDPDLFNPISERYREVDLSLRCFRFPEAIHPVTRFVDGLIQLRRNPEELAYVAVAGVPTDVSGMSPDVILASPYMQEEVDPSAPTRLLSSCESSTGRAFPPRRIVEVGRGLQARGASVGHESICQDSLAEARRGAVRAIAGAVGAVCLDRPLSRRVATDMTSCRVYETLPAGSTCAARAAEGRTLVGTRQLGGSAREVCEVEQRVVEVEGIDGTVSGPGWVYESTGRFVRASGIREACPGVNPGRIYFSAPPQPGATVLLVCDGG